MLSTRQRFWREDLESAVVRMRDGLQQQARPRRQIAEMGCLILLLILILATMLAGPIGFLLALVLVLTWAIVTGSLRLLVAVLLLPFRVLERLLGGR